MQDLIDEVAARLVEHLDFLQIAPESIVTIGLLNSIIHPWLKKQYPAASLNSVLLPCDMILSHWSLLNEPNPVEWFKKVFSLLRPNGLFLFSSLGPDSFKELRGVVDAVLFPDMHDVGDILLSLGFMDPVMDAEWITLEYETLSELAEELSDVFFFEVLDANALQQYPCNSAGYYEVTLELVYGQAWKPAGARMQEGEARISLESVRRSAKQSRTVV